MQVKMLCLVLPTLAMAALIFAMIAVYLLTR